MYAPSVTSTTLPSPSAVNVPFGFEARYKFLYCFQFSVATFFVADTEPYLMFLTDLGFTVDLKPFTIGGAFGPDFFQGFTATRAPESSVLNFRLTADMSFGAWSLGIVVADPITTLSQLKTNIPWVGLTALYTVF